MSQTTENRGVFWLCQSCKGRGLTVAALRRSVAVRYVNSLWRLAADGQGRRNRRCPACAAPMAEVALSQNSAPMEIDVCRTCYFVWFDPGEYEAAPPRPDEPVRALLPHLQRMLDQHKSEVVELRQWKEDWMAHPPLHPAALPWDVILGVHGIDRPGGLRRLPLITWTLAAALLLGNLVLLERLNLLDILLGNIPLPARLFEYGLMPAHLWRLGGFTLITHGVFHVHGIQLLCNVVAFIMIGDDVEDDLGSVRFFVLVTLGVCLGALSHAAAFLRSTTVLVGPVAAICAVMTYSMLRFPRGWQLFWKHDVRHPIGIPSALVMLFWVGMQVVMTRFEPVFRVELVSVAQVCGGLGAGALCWYLLERAAPPIESVA